MQKNRGIEIEFLDLFIFNKLGLNCPILVASTIESFDNLIWQRLYNIESCSRWWNSRMQSFMGDFSKFDKVRSSTGLLL